MAELTISPEEITEALKRHVESFKPQVMREEVGHVTTAGDGIARVEGLPGTMSNELLEFGGGVVGVAFNLDVREIGCVILSEDFEQIEEGDEVKRTGRVLSVRVGDAFRARVIDPLARPGEGRGHTDAE